MNEINLIFSDEIEWNNYYRRNNKTGAIKNLQCFPNHTNGVHKVYFFI